MLGDCFLVLWTATGGPVGGAGGLPTGPDRARDGCTGGGLHYAVLWGMDGLQQAACTPRPRVTVLRHLIEQPIAM